MSGQVKQATSQGARRVAGGSDPDGAFYAASVIVDQEASTDVSHNTEIFGPVLDIIPFDSVDRAVEIANASVYGLIGSVFSADIGRAMTIALEMQTGQVVINGTGNYRADESAWGGYKLSGNDREGLGLSLEEFMQTKTLTLRKAIKRG
jgi:acyl-CoA reductase-like NAD-dependent aldehyde dehydrogenase